LGFGGGGVSKLTAHTHNETLAGDGGQLSQALTDMNGVTLYSEITDNSAAVAVNTAAIAVNTAAIAAIGEVPSGAVIIWTNSIASIPAGYTFYQDIQSNNSQLTENDNRQIFNGQPRTEIGQQFNTGSESIGKRPTKVTWYMFSSGSPTGSAFAYITDSSGVARETSSTTLDVSTLPTGAVNSIAVEFTFAGTTTIAASDMIVIKYTGGDNSNTVDVATSNSAAVANEILRLYTGTWANVTGEAAAYTVAWDFAYILKS
jgi:hypothetical protein|tara:strand:+ start:618 stop:1394 length:777 start_codon:yes stop_codon:yes gene_type:complete